jgi:hypothetical protein
MTTALNASRHSGVKKLGANELNSSLTDLKSGARALGSVEVAL